MIEDENALELLAMLEESGYEAWFVGGCVRDALLGRPVNDIDIACSAPWEETKRACEAHGCTVHETGTKHGTVTVVMPEGNDGQRAFEVTTYRIDSAEYSDSRHPDSVTFTIDIEEDLKRRDFTINAMAWHPQRGLLDPFDGKGDLERGVIRTVGDPKTRFREDALRILRACRFCSQLGFAIDPETYEAMVSSKCLLARVSTERVTHELDELLLGDYVHDALMRTVDVLAFVLPELVAMKDCEQRTKYHIYDVLEHTAFVVQNTPPYRLVRWAALCHDMGKPAAAFFEPDGKVEHFYGHAYVSMGIARGLLHRLLMSNAFIEDVVTLVRYHDHKLLEPTEKSVRQTLRKLDGRMDMFGALCDLKRADALSQSSLAQPKLEKLACVGNVLQDVLEQEQAFTVKGLAITGRDLIDAGFEQGPAIGEALEAALDAVIEDGLANEREAIIRYCVEFLKR